VNNFILFFISIFFMVIGLMEVQKTSIILSLIKETVNLKNEPYRVNYFHPNLNLKI